MSKTTLATHIPQQIVQPFDLCFSSGRGFVSAVIQDADMKLLTGSQFSHVAIALEYKGELYWYEALAEGVVRSPMSRYCDKWMVAENKIKGVALSRLTVPIREVPAKLILVKANSLVGKRYDYIGLVLFLWRLFMKLFSREVDTPHTEDRWFCSELVADVLNAGGIKPVSQLPQSTSPQDLFESEIVKQVYPRI